MQSASSGALQRERRQLEANTSKASKSRMYPAGRGEGSTQHTFIRQIDMEVRKRLTKYTSVAQKYAQEKALKEGRSADSKVRPTEELVPKELWQYLDRFDKERAKRLPKPSKWDIKIEFIEGSVLPKPGPVYSLSP